MALFSEKGLYYTIATIAVIFIANSIGNKLKDAINPEKNEDELIRKYLLNESPLYGYNRPKMWVHTTYEYNSRKWKSFGSRSSTDLNQPYIHLTIKSIINHCGDDFNVCLIDDDSFSQLIPGWKINVSELPEPQREHFREMALIELLYIYGGIIVPNSFICFRNLISLYAKGIENDKAFTFEVPNKYANILNSEKNKQFLPSSLFLGAPKRSPIIRDLVEYLKKRNDNPHVSAENEFFGYTSKWLYNEIIRKNVLSFDGINIGTKTLDNKPVIIEDLLGEEALKFCNKRTYGVYIPYKEILTRTCYNWFAVMKAEEIFKSNMIIKDYLSIGIREIIPVEERKNEYSKSIVSI